MVQGFSRDLGAGAPRPHKVGVIVPTRDRFGVPVDEDHEFWVERWASLFAECFGGYSTRIGEGGFRTEAGELIREDHTFVFGFATDEALTEAVPRIRALLQVMLQALNQETLGVEFDGTFILFGEIDGDSHDKALDT